MSSNYKATNWLNHISKISVMKKRAARHVHKALSMNKHTFCWRSRWLIVSLNTQIRTQIYTILFVNISYFADAVLSCSYNNTFCSMTKTDQFWICLQYSVFTRCVFKMFINSEAYFVCVGFIKTSRCSYVYNVFLYKPCLPELIILKQHVEYCSGSYRRFCVKTFNSVRIDLEKNISHSGMFTQAWSIRQQRKHWFKDLKVNKRIGMYNCKHVESHLPIVFQTWASWHKCEWVS